MFKILLNVKPLFSISNIHRYLERVIMYVSFGSSIYICFHLFKLSTGISSKFEITQ